MLCAQDINMDENQSENGLPESKPWLFRAELVLAAAAITIAIIWGLWPYFNIANNTYPTNVDSMGHLTKIQFLADCFSEFKWPSWFPYMDNGSNTFQYGAPAPKIFLALIEILTANTMLTFKSGIFFAQFIGGLGVWYTCRRFFGPWIGIVGGVLYSVQPMLLMAFLNIGEINQIIMFAITPWYFCFSLLLLEKPTPGRWLFVCLSSTLMIFSHAMSALLICIGLGVIMAVLLAMRKGEVKPCILWFIAMGLSAGLEAFWGVPSFTHLEHPLMPVTMPELVISSSASTALFNPAIKHNYYYAGCVLFLLALIPIIQMKKNKWILPLIISMLITIGLSYGNEFPLFQYIPLSNNFVPRKFLFFTVIVAVMLDVFLLKELMSRFRKSGYLGKALCLLAIACITVLLAVDTNPRRSITHYPSSFLQVQQGMEKISVTDKPFEQGRFSPLGAFPSWYFYFCLNNGLNSTHGNQTSSPYTITNTQHNIAISTGCPDYIVKNLLNWNSHYVYVNGEFRNLHDDLLKHGYYQKEYTYDVTYVNPAPSSYFLRQQRDSIAIGLAATPFVITFPWLVQGDFASLEKYSPQYLDRFKLIYLIEPDVKDFLKFQEMVYKLLDSGKTVVVSMGSSKAWPLAGIIPYWENIPDGSKLVPTDGSPFKQQLSLDSDPDGQVPAMGNLDGVWMEMYAGTKHVPAIGYKNINGHKLYFIGLNLDKQLNPAIRWARGYQGDVGHSKQIASILEQIMDIGQPNKNFIPEAFPVSDQKWENDSFSFNYKSDQPVSVLVSITYSLHWKAKLDDSPLNVQQLENLILLDLPSGEHQVKMNYGMTWVGWIGIVVSILSLLMVVLIYCRFDHMHRFFEFINLRIRQAVEELRA